jgi:hypothetical protein
MDTLRSLSENLSYIQTITSILKAPRSFIRHQTFRFHLFISFSACKFFLLNPCNLSQLHWQQTRLDIYKEMTHYNPRLNAKSYYDFYDTINSEPVSLLDVSTNV